MNARSSYDLKKYDDQYHNEFDRYRKNLKKWDPKASYDFQPMTWAHKKDIKLHGHSDLLKKNKSVEATHMRARQSQMSLQ